MMNKYQEALDRIGGVIIGTTGGEYDEDTGQRMRSDDVYAGECAIEEFELLQELVNKESTINKDTESHSEKEILNMCVRLMQCVYGDMLDYMEFMGFDVPRNEDDEGYPTLNYSYSQIVQTLFLSRTTHSGGTSTRMKCDELGVDGSDIVEFKPEDRDGE